MSQHPSHRRAAVLTFVAAAALLPAPSGFARQKTAAKPVVQPAVKATAPASAKSGATAVKARVKADNLTAPAEASPVPATGPLNLEQLLQLAIFNNPEILRRRGEAEVARAARKAATDWEDPELRFSWSTQTDIEVGSPYTERSVSREHYSGTEFDRQSTRGMGEYRIDTERTRFSEDRYRTVERQVIPGATRDKIITTEYETRRTNSRGNRTRVDGFNGGVPISRNDATGRQNGRRIAGRSVTYRYHDDDTTPEDSYELLLRFPFPNPWQMKANVAMAEAEIREADFTLKAIEDEVILDVRELYEEIAYYEFTQAAQTALNKEQQDFLKVTQGVLTDKIAKAANDTLSSKVKAFSAGQKAAERRRDLARLVGLADPSRIAIPKSFRRRVVDLGGASLPYLIEMARIYRADLNLLHAKNELARAEYREAQSLKIPAAAFVDVAVGRDYDRQGRDETELQLRVGVSLPLWSWLFNDAERVPEAAARAYSRQIGRMANSIEGDVIASLEALRAAEKMMKEFESQAAAAEVLAKEGQVAALMSEKVEQGVSESRQLVRELAINRLEVIRLYNLAVLELERALGTRLEKILTPQP